ncbi:MAG: hypothetical protein NW217_07185 [Hyphomicrobiaceae bacterium]|nr:hypothetical protein [Hyphomicrobiaceae bacterium]
MIRLSETWQRTLVAGPLALLAAVVVLATLPHLIPEGAGRVDNLVLPVIAFPLVWSATFFYACIADNISRAAAVLAGLTAAGLGVIAHSLALI